MATITARDLTRDDLPLPLDARVGDRCDRCGATIVWRGLRTSTDPAPYRLACSSCAADLGIVLAVVAPRTPGWDTRCG